MIGMKKHSLFKGLIIGLLFCVSLGAGFSQNRQLLKKIVAKKGLSIHSISFSPKIPHPGDRLEISVEVKNNHRIMILRNITVEARKDSEIIGRKKISFIRPYKQKKVIFIYNLPNTIADQIKIEILLNPPSGPKKFKELKIGPSKAGKMIIIKPKKLPIIIPGNMDVEPKIIFFSAERTEIQYGQNTTLSWKVENSESVEIKPEPGRVEAEGSTIITPSETKEYEIIAKNRYKSANLKLKIVVKPQCVFNASSLKIRAGKTVTLNWSTAGATHARIEPDIGDVSPSGGVKYIEPLETTTYTFIASSKEEESRESVTINVFPKIQIDFFAEPTRVTEGGSTVLHWEVKNADKIAITEDGNILNEPQDKKGIISINYPENDCRIHNYRLIAEASDPEAEEQKNIEVFVETKPEIHFYTLGSKICEGDRIKLGWQIIGDLVNEAYIYPGHIKVEKIKSGDVEVCPEKTQTYRMEVVTHDGFKFEKESKEVKVFPRIKILNFEVDKTEVMEDEGFTVSWEIENAEDASLLYGKTPYKINPKSGSQTLYGYEKATSVKLSAWNGGGVCKSETEPIPIKTVLRPKIGKFLPVNLNYEGEKNQVRIFSYRIPSHFNKEVKFYYSLENFNQEYSARIETKLPQPREVGSRTHPISWKVQYFPLEETTGEIMLPVDNPGQEFELQIKSKEDGWTMDRKKVKILIYGNVIEYLKVEPDEIPNNSIVKVSWKTMYVDSLLIGGAVENPKYQGALEGSDQFRVNFYNISESIINLTVKYEQDGKEEECSKYVKIFLKKDSSR